MATAAPAAPAPAEEGAEAKPKSKLVPLILAVTALIVVIVATIGLTLWLSGFFAKPAVNADAVLAQDAEHGAAAEGDHGAPAEGGHGEKPAEGEHGEKKAEGDKPSDPPALKKKSPDSLQFEYSYLQLDKDFLVNLMGSKKVMSVQIAIMTRYDDRVFENVKKHELILRGVMLDIMRMTTETDLTKPDFRKDLAAKLRDAMNTQLEKYENFGGIEELIFTGFVVQ
jgi:flagellar FliL protein